LRDDAQAHGGDRPITLAILAMGGQGGGVLADWIVALAEAHGWAAQSTSVPGVAQRTGATIYYVEMMPPQDGRLPVLSLMPTPGDVDVVIAAELMEAGRSLLRGLVTPDRTTLIASTHRSYAISEKEKPGNGIADPEAVMEAVGVAARQAVIFDMQALAEQNGSVISAAMFGALAATGVLPFSQEGFEAAIRTGGKGVEPSLRAFAAAFACAANPAATTASKPRDTAPAAATSTVSPELDRLLRRIEGEAPPEAQSVLLAGVKRLVDYQDVAYADEYLDRIAAVRRLDERFGGAARGYPFTQAAAKYLAVAMAYDDVIRVADLKTRASRFERIDAEVGRKPGQILYMTEFMHPRMEEVAGTLPAGVGEWLEARPKLFRRLDNLVNRGRRVRTGTIGWFLCLYLLSGLRPARRRLLRHKRETAHLAGWLEVATRTIAKDYDLSVEVLRSRRLVKGYSDTHARGTSKFDQVVSMVPFLLDKPDAAGWLRRLQAAALSDEDGEALKGALLTLRSAFADGDAGAASSPG
jgi:indolepyruvate ferredoxin oxidoreductase, beta subunit